MTITIADFRTKVGIIIKDTAGILSLTATSGDVDQLILSAVEFYSKRKPRMLYQKYTGNGGYSYAMPTSWVDGFSDIRSLEYPSGEQVPVYLQTEDWEIHTDDTGSKIRFLDDSPGISESFIVGYTVPHTLSAAASTIYANDFEALCYLAASYCCKAISKSYAQSSEPIINADAVDYKSKSSEYAKRAEELYKDYERLMIESEETVDPGSVVKDFDTGFIWGGRHLTHPKEYR